MTKWICLEMYDREIRSDHGRRVKEPAIIRNAFLRSAEAWSYGGEREVRGMLSLWGRQLGERKLSGDGKRFPISLATWVS